MAAAEAGAFLTARAEPKAFTRRDHMLEVERRVQARWAEQREFETDAPADGSDNVAVPKFMATFPYPYMNGRLHLGHAFSVTKADFAAGFQRLKGKRVLFPFSFHCTGMPIQAAANKLKREIETGAHLAVLARLKAAAEGGAAAEEEAVEEAAEEAAAAPAEAPAAAEGSAAAAAGGGGADVPAAGAPAEERVKELGKFSGKKSKAVAKGAAGSPMTQFEIMLKSGLAPEEIPAFTDPRHWLSYFPPLGQADLQLFGLHADWRRSFITTEANPYYDSFIRWQFNTLKARGKLGFGKRPTIFSPLDGQACADHDRASGEGVGPQEYTLIKLRLQGVPAEHKAAAAGKLGGLQELLAAGRKVYFVAATLRPETMYGQTNCYLLPEGEYGIFDVTTPAQAEAGTPGDVFVCSERSARNMSYQGLARERGKPVQLGSCTGEDLLGLPLEAPYATFPTVYTLPLLTISMKKGTGVVTSVPSDAPDDWAALRDLQEKPKLREKYGLTEAMTNLPVVEIIEIPGYGRKAAVTVCDQLKIKSQNDTALLKQAKELTYMAGFYQGVMLVGKYAGKKVAEAKPLVRADMFAEGLAAPYWEPESTVVSRSGDECVVAELDQWYLKYGEEEWREAVLAWVRSKGFTAYSAATLGSFEATLSWLQEWACSRSFGLGTALPWDTQFVIESLSDSTIYMAFYTVAHLLQRPGALDGAAPGPLGIAPADMTHAAWDYVLLEAEYPADGSCPVPQAKLDALRREFRYWYPMDLRVSGKDLINNHLTMSLYNHAAIWFDEAAKAARPDRMPQSFFCNGHVLVDGEKMSKSKGNFIMLHEAIARWSADATRFALADAGDSLDDANFERDTADAAILRLTTEEEYTKDMVAAAAEGKLRMGELSYADRVFDSRINACIRDAEAQYAAMRFREALKAAFYELQLARDTYRDMCDKLGTPVHADVIRRFFEVQYVLLAPICPHFADYMWGDVLGHWADAPGADGKPPSVTRAPWPAAGPVDDVLLAADAYMAGKLHAFRLAIGKLTKPPKPGKAAAAAPPAKPTHANIFVASAWPSWQRKPLEMLAAMWDPAAHGKANGGFPEDATTRVKDAAMADPELRPVLKKLMPLVGQTIQAMKERDTPTAALALKLPFDEYAVWTENRDYVRKALELPGEVVIYRTDDPLLAPGSESAKALDPSGKAKDVVPLEADIHPYVG